MPKLSRSYADNMAYWVVGKYFDPEVQRHRVLLHDYQQSEIQEMRCMDNIKLIDSINLPLKTCESLVTAFRHVLSNGLEGYLKNFVAPFVGDWPTQFFKRQLIYSNSASLPTAVKNVAPLIGPFAYLSEFKGMRADEFSRSFC